MKDLRAHAGKSAWLRLDERTSPVLTTLRDLMPNRPLTKRDAFSVAEHQALRLLSLLEVQPGPVSIAALMDACRSWIVAYDANLPTSGMTTWNPTKQSWVTIINASEPSGRQRFSIGHELKHLIDHPIIFFAYVKSDGEPWQQKDIELVCDYFAGCLLMPRPWVKRAYVGGLQRERQLAEHFEVSEAAMRVRLGQLGLRTSDPLRTDTELNDGDLHSYRRTARRPTGVATMQDAISGLGQPPFEPAVDALKSATNRAIDLPPPPSEAIRMSDSTPTGVGL